MIDMRNFFLVIFLLNSINSLSQTVVREGARRPEILTPSAFPKGNPTGYPFIELGSEQTLEFHFDEEGNDRNDYQFGVIHCDHDWTPSDLESAQFLNGFSQLEITDVEGSFGTQFDYVHYRFNFPNDMMKPVVSGNYAVVVFSDGDMGDQESWQLVWRVVIYESLVRFRAKVQQSSVVKNRFSDHEILCEIIADNYRIYDPYSEIHLSILSNGDWNRSINDLKPTFVKPDGLVFQYSDGRNTLPAGNEWRDFEMKNLQFNSMNVESISPGADGWYVQLRPDLPRGNRANDSRFDLNGKYLVRSDIASDSHLESEYAWVHFTLKMPEAIESKVVIVGGISRLLSEPWEMKYVPAIQAYSYTALVKQGYYNYQYEMIDLYHPGGDHSFTEGNYSTTENDYHIFVYHYDRGLGCDRAVGAQALNSVR